MKMNFTKIIAVICLIAALAAVAMTTAFAAIPSQAAIEHIKDCDYEVLCVGENDPLSASSKECPWRGIQGGGYIHPEDCTIDKRYFYNRMIYCKTCEVYKNLYIYTEEDLPFGLVHWEDYSHCNGTVVTKMCTYRLYGNTVSLLK